MFYSNLLAFYLKGDTQPTHPRSRKLDEQNTNTPTLRCNISCLRDTSSDTKSGGWLTRRLVLFVSEEESQRHETLHSTSVFCAPLIQPSTSKASQLCIPVQTKKLILSSMLFLFIIVTYVNFRT